LVLSPIGREKSPGASIGRRLGESASFGQKLKLINNRLIIRLWSSKSNASKTNIKRQLLQRTQRVLIFQFFIKIFRELTEEKSPVRKKLKNFPSRVAEKKKSMLIERTPIDIRFSTFCTRETRESLFRGRAFLLVYGDTESAGLATESHRRRFQRYVFSTYERTGLITT